MHAAGELDRRIVDEDARQRRRRIVDAGDLDTVLPRTGDLQHDAVGAALQLLEDDLVGGGRIGFDDALMDLPAETLHVGMRAARERRLPRHRRFGARQRVGARIKRLDAQTVGRLGHQLLVEVATLQCLVDELAPLFVGGGCEVGSERGRVGHVAKVRFSAQQVVPLYRHFACRCARRKRTRAKAASLRRARKCVLWRRNTFLHVRHATDVCKGYPPMP